MPWALRPRLLFRQPTPLKPETIGTAAPTAAVINQPDIYRADARIAVLKSEVRLTDEQGEELVWP